jgi:hypothetical protein
MESGWFDIVYEDIDCMILRIRDQKGETPSGEGEPGDIPTEEPLANEEP